MICLRASRDRLQPGRAEAVDRRRRHLDREARRAAPTSRATLSPCDASGIAQPQSRRRSSPASTPARSIAAFITRADRSTGCVVASAPSFFPRADRRSAPRKRSRLRRDSLSSVTLTRSTIRPQFLSGLPVFSMYSMRSCVSFVPSSRRNASRSRSRMSCSVTTRGGPSPPAEHVGELVRDAHLVIGDLPALAHRPAGVEQVAERLLARAR